MITVRAKLLALAASTASQFRAEQLTGFEQSGKKVPGAGPRTAPSLRLSAQNGTLLVRVRSAGSEMAIPLAGHGGALQGLQNFDAWVDARLLISYCRRAETDLTLGVRGAHLVLQTGQTSLELPLGDAQPDLPWEELPVRAVFRADALLDAVLHVRSMRAEGGINSAMLRAWRGVLLDGNGSAMRAVTGNGFSVAICALPYQGEALRLLIPPGELNGLLAVLSAEGKGTVRLHSDEKGSRLELLGGHGHVRMNLMDHLAFPQYARVIPKGNPLIVRADADELRRALKQIQPLIASEKREVRLEVKRGRVELSCHNEYGAARADFEAETEGHGVILFNHTQLLQACSVRGILTLSMGLGSGPALVVRGAYVVVVAVLRPAQTAA